MYIAAACLKQFRLNEITLSWSRNADTLHQARVSLRQRRLLFIVEALKDLLADEGFLNLLRAEGLETMPRALATRISGGCDE
ncbi:hypothetical protein GOB02_25135 [Sinorhizobium meliloti]|nr:hypothetical protein [Sinorhizobium meliloti]